MLKARQAAAIIATKAVRRAALFPSNDEMYNSGRIAGHAACPAPDCGWRKLDFKWESSKASSQLSHVPASFHSLASRNSFVGVTWPIILQLSSPPTPTRVEARLPPRGGPKNNRTNQAENKFRRTHKACATQALYTGRH